MRDDLHSAWVYFVRPGLEVLRSQGLSVDLATGAAVLAAGYMATGYRYRSSIGDGLRYGFWRMTPKQTVVALRDPRFAETAERVCSVLAIPYELPATVHEAVRSNDYLAPALATFYLLSGPADRTRPHPIQLTTSAADLRSIYIDDRWPGIWQDSVWRPAVDVVLNA